MYGVDEIMVRRYIKAVMNRGIPKYMASEIVHSARDASKGENINLYIDYAITLTYGLNLKSKHLTKDKPMC